MSELNEVEALLWGMINLPGTTLHVDEIETNPDAADYGKQTPHYVACLALQEKGLIELVEVHDNQTVWRRVEALEDGRN